MSLLTQAQAEEYVKQAHHQSYGDYHFGQALWNILPNRYTRDLARNGGSFCFTKDDDEALEMFYKHLVKGCGEV